MSQSTMESPHTSRDEPSGPIELPGQGWVDVLRRTVSEFRDDGLTDWAASLTYYGVLSIFPGLIALVSILGLIGPSATQPLIDNLRDVAPGPAQQIVTDSISGIEQSRSSATAVFVVGLATAIWAASGYIGAFARASNIIYETKEGRPFWLLKPQQLGITILMLILLAGSALAVVFTGPIADEAANVIGLPEKGVSYWDLVKWPILIVVVGFMVALLYYMSPNVKHRGFRWITPGSILAVVLWVLASLLFGVYVSNFGSYNATYGALGGVVVFLIWLWITNIAILLGDELNAELERSRELAEGNIQATRQIQVEPKSPAD